MGQEIIVTKENFHKIQRQGKMNVRLMILLYTFLWIVYGVAFYFLLNMLFITNYPDVMKNFLIHYTCASIIWLIIFIQLWRFSKLGRLLFALFSFVSLYTIKDILLIYDIEVIGWDMKMMQLLCIMLIGVIKMAGLACTWYLFVDKAICCIWSLLEMYEDQLEEDDDNAIDVQTLIVQEAHHVQIDKENKFAQRTRAFSKRYAIQLLIVMYVSLFIIYLFMFYMQYNFPNDIDGLKYVQRTLFLSCLFTILIWTLPMLTLFTYKRGTKYILILIWIIEVVQLGWEVPQIIQVFQTQHYQMTSIVCLIVLHIVRYVPFLRITISMFQNPFMQMFWKHKGTNVTNKNKKV